MLLDVKTRLSGGVAILTLSGRATAGQEAEALRTQIMQAFSKSSHFLLLDCENLGYVDSAAIGEMVSAYSAIVRQGGMLKLLRPHARLRHTLEIAKVTRVINIEEDEAAAIVSFNQAGAAKSRQALNNFLSEP